MSDERWRVLDTLARKIPNTNADHEKRLKALEEWMAGHNTEAVVTNTDIVDLMERVDRLERLESRGAVACMQREDLQRGLDGKSVQLYPMDAAGPEDLIVISTDQPVRCVPDMCNTTTSQNEMRRADQPAEGIQQLCLERGEELEQQKNISRHNFELAQKYEAERDEVDRTLWVAIRLLKLVEYEFFADDERQAEALQRVRAFLKHLEGGDDAPTGQKVSSVDDPSPASDVGADELDPDDYRLEERFEDLGPEDTLAEHRGEK